MTEFNFYLSDRDTERLFALKELQGRHDLTGNEYARMLLEEGLERLFATVPGEPEEDFQPHGLNPQEFRAAVLAAEELEKEGRK